jgi:hypothetical protein
MPCSVVSCSKVRTDVNNFPSFAHYLSYPRGVQLQRPLSSCQPVIYGFCPFSSVCLHAFHILPNHHRFQLAAGLPCASCECCRRVSRLRHVAHIGDNAQRRDRRRTPLAPQGDSLLSMSANAPDTPQNAPRKPTRQPVSPCCQQPTQRYTTSNSQNQHPVIPAASIAAFTSSRITTMRSNSFTRNTRASPMASRRNTAFQTPAI